MSVTKLWRCEIYFFNPPLKSISILVSILCCTCIEQVMALTLYL